MDDDWRKDDSSIFDGDDGGASGDDPSLGAVRDAEESGVTPGFLGGNDDWDGVAYRLNGEDYDKNDKKIKRDKKKQSAAKGLASAEKNASEGDLEGTNVMKKETSGGSKLFSGSGKKKSSKKGGKKGFAGKLKKSAPILAIFGGMIGVIAMISSSQNLLPIAIKEMIAEKLNSVGVSSTMASDDWLDTQLNQGVRMEKLSSNNAEEKFAFSSYQVQQFEKFGIKVVGGDDGDQIAALLYEKDGQYIPVVGSTALEEYSDGEIINAVQTSASVGNIGNPVSAEVALKDDDFKIPYTKAAKAWRGGVSGWFDNIMSDITETKLNVTRNRWSKYIAKYIKSVTEDFKKVAKNQNKINDKGVSAKNDTTETNEDGETVTKVKETDDVGVIKDGDDAGAGSPNNTADTEGTGETINVSNDKVTGRVTTVESVRNILESKAVKAASTGATVGCAVINGLISIYTLVSAEQKIQFLNLISGFLESVDKVKAGDGSGSPLDEYGMNLTTKSDTRDDNDRPVEGKEGRTAVESAGMAWLFGKNNVVSQSDASVRNVNFESIMSNISVLTSNIRLTTDVYAACGYAKIGAAAIDLAATVLAVVTAGTAKAVWEVIAKPSVKAVIKGIALATLLVVIPIAAKNYAKMLLNDVATEWFGEDLGNALVSGASSYLGGNGTSGGQGGGTMPKLVAYLGERDSVVAEEAKYQRATRDPFDITSRHTFLGSLAYAVLPIAYGGGGILRNVANMSNLVSSSAVAVLPTASAVGESNELTSVGDCDLLSSTGAVGDGFCNPYIITDTSTIDTSPVAVSNIVYNLGGDTVTAASDVYANVGSENFDDNGKIKKNSNLGKYITYCGQRTSQYGLYDASITAQLTGSDSVVSTIIGFVPVANDFQDIGQAVIENVDRGYITGEACVASDDDYWTNENRWYQRYAENERLLENMNPGYTSTVTAYLREYYEENPLDQSYEGTLARFTGMSKEQVEDTLALIDYYEFLNEYNPNERYAFGKPAVEAEKELKFDSGNSVAEQVWGILLGQISYADVRNRNFAA